MKTFIAFFTAVILLAGCADKFTGPSVGPSGETGSRVLYTRLENSLVFSNIPAGSIVQRELGSNIESVVITAPAYLLCAPQNGRMLYAHYEFMSYVGGDSLFSWVIRLGDVDGRNSEVITPIGGIVSVMIQDAALSPDGRTVAYAITEGIDSYNQLIDRLYIYRSGTPGPVVIDSIKQTVKPGNSGSLSAGSLLSHLAFSPDNGSHLAAAFWGADKRIRLYNLLTGTRMMIGNRTGPFVAWSPDGTQLLFSQHSSGMYFNEPILSREMLPPIEYATGFPYSSSLVVANLNNVSTTLVTGLMPVLDVAWSRDGQIACSVLRQHGTLAMGTDIISFHYSNPVLQDTLTTTMTEPMTKGRFQWADDGKLLLFTQGYYLGDYSPYSLIASEIGYIHANTQHSTIMCSGASGVYWLDASATSVIGSYKPSNTDSLYTVPHRN